jgi:CubicO group peptidase (beta-lactamase class C family)
MHRFLSVLILIVFLFCQNNLVKIDNQNISQKLGQFTKNQKIASLSFTLFQGKDILIDTAFGFADVNKKIKSTSKHKYPLASVSKPITASILLDFVNKGLISVTDSVYHYLPKVPKNITIANLLTHTSGYHVDIVSWTNTIQKPLNELVNYLPKQKKKIKFDYNNINYSLIGAVLEEVSSIPFSTLAKNYVSKSSDSAKVNFLDEMTYSDDSLLVRSYLKRRGKLYWHNPIKGQMIKPAALAVSSSHDAVKFLRQHMSVEYIKEISKDLVLVNRWKRKDDSISEEYYGFGFRFNFLDGKLKYIFHNGYIYGALSTMYYLPEYDIGFVALCNTSTYPEQYFNFSSAILNILKGSLEELETDLIEDFVEPD